MRETGSSQPGTRCALVSFAVLLGCHSLGVGSGLFVE